MNNSKTGLGLVLIILAIIGWFVLVRPQTETYTSQLKSTKIKNAEYRAYKVRQEQLEKIKSQWGDTAGVIQKMVLAMPRQSQVPEALVMVESLANSSGVNLSNVTVGTPSDREVPVSFSFTGSTDRLIDFLNKLNNNVRTVVIHNQTMTSDISGNLTINIQGGLVFQGNQAGGQ